MGKYRPEGWNKIRDNYARKDFGDLASGKAVNMFESGADAMLEELRKNKIEVIPHWGALYHVNHPTNGMYVFIPDDEQ